MRNILSIAKRIILQMLGDRRSLALILVAPILVISLMWVIINGGTSTAKIAVLSAPDPIMTELQKNAAVTAVRDTAEGRGLVKDQKADAFLDFSGDQSKLLVDGANSSITAVVGQAIQKSMMSAVSALPFVASKAAQLKPEIEFLYGSTNSKAFDFVAPVMMGFIIFFFIFILSGVSFLRERLTGTLERVLSTPTGQLEIVVGYMLGFGFFATIQTILIQVFLIYVLGVPALGGFGDILAVNLSLVLVSLSLGSLISAFAQNEFQVFQFIPVIIVPQIMFAGIFDLREAPQWLQALGDIFPLTYAGEALRDIMVRGKSLGQAFTPFAIVLGFALLFILLNALVLRKGRR